MSAIKEVYACPFCGGEGMVIRDTFFKAAIMALNASAQPSRLKELAGLDFYCVECWSCHAESQHFTVPEDAIENWNRRVKK